MFHKIVLRDGIRGLHLVFCCFFVLPQQRKLGVKVGAGRSSQNPIAQGSQAPGKGFPSKVRKGSHEAPTVEMTWKGVWMQTPLLAGLRAGSR